MILSDTDQYIKDSLETIISGRWDEHFDPVRIKTLLELSFILNHLDIGIGFFQFEYNGLKVKAEVPDVIPQTEYYFEGIISSIKNDEYFKKALNQFIRDKKIDSLISE